MKKLLSLLSFFVSACVVAQSSMDLSLARRLLLENNINLKQSQLKEKIISINRSMALDAMIPTFQFNATNQYALGLTFDQISGKLITGDDWLKNANVSVSTSVVLFQGFFKKNSYKLEKINEELSKLDTEKLQFELEIQLITLFFQTLINKDLHIASKSQLDYSVKQLEQLEAEVEVGKRTLIDFAQGKSKVANDRLNVINTKNAYELSLMQFKELLSIEKEKLIELNHTSLNVEKEIASLRFDLSDPFVEQISKQIEQADYQLKIAKAGYYPTISFNGGYGTNYSSQRLSPLNFNVVPFWAQLNQNRLFYGIFSISMPIYDGFRANANVKKANLNKTILILEEDRITRSRILQHAEAELAYQSALEEHEAVKTAFEANRLNFEIMTERFNVGKNSSIDLFKALTEFNLSEFKLITAHLNLQFRYEIIKRLNQISKIR